MSKSINKFILCLVASPGGSGSLGTIVLKDLKLSETGLVGYSGSLCGVVEYARNIQMPIKAPGAYNTIL